MISTNSLQWEAFQKIYLYQEQDNFFTSSSITAEYYTDTYFKALRVFLDWTFEEIRAQKKKLPKEHTYIKINCNYYCKNFTFIFWLDSLILIILASPKSPLHKRSWMWLFFSLSSLSHCSHHVTDITCATLLHVLSSEQRWWHVTAITSDYITCYIDYV